MEKQGSRQNPLRELLLTKAREMTHQAGVYLMKDEQGGILYVGKAKNLKNRVTSYFQPIRHEIPRTELLVSQIIDFEVILTETEAEALILEATLIKKHRPRWNIRLKDDKAYPYLKIQVEKPFPRIEWTRRTLRDGARYFGPFPSAWAARQVLKLLNETFQLRDCSDNTFSHRSRPCILHQIGKCSAPCVLKVNEEQYRAQIDHAVSALEGKTDALIADLRARMEAAAEQEDFESAAEVRDQIRNLEIVTATQGMLDPESRVNVDVVGLARKEGEIQLCLLQIRLGKVLSVQHYAFQNGDAEIPDPEILKQFLAQHYGPLRTEMAGLDAPPDVLLPLELEDRSVLEDALGVSIRVPEAESPSSKTAQFLNVARLNAEHALEQSRKRQLSHGIQALEEVQEKLQLDRLPRRIECYDISNIQGEDAVASRVVFLEGAPEKSLYRRYKIRTVEGANDFAMMKETLGRRFSHAEEPLPDLVVVDGGKGQLAQAVAIFLEFGIRDVAVVGLAKARVERDFESTEVRSSSERVFLPGRKNPVMLLPHQGSYKLLTHVRDEAHRFAVSYHRVVRSKRILGE